VCRRSTCRVERGPVRNGDNEVHKKGNASVSVGRGCRGVAVEANSGVRLPPQYEGRDNSFEEVDGGDREEDQR
jgi:hypothetical protein